METQKKRFQLYEHPWWAMLAVMVTSVFSIMVTGSVLFGRLGLPDTSPYVQFTQALSFHILTGFILVPFVLRLPRGKTTFRQYLDDIGFSRMRPFFKLVLLALSCYVFVFLSQAAASIVFRLTQGLPLNWAFIQQVFDLSPDLPPDSTGLLTTIPSMLEEVAFRGIVLTTFLNKYSERKSIIFSSLGFGLIHLLNILMGRDVIWVLGQVVWAFSIGLFYGYVFVRTKSLLPSMIVHYLSNAFIGSLTGYLQSRASIEIQALYGVIFSLGFVPTALMIWWARFYIKKWLPVAVSNEA